MERAATTCRLCGAPSASSLACRDCADITLRHNPRARGDGVTITTCRECGLAFATGGLRVNQCERCRREGRRLNDPENRRWAALVIGALALIGQPARASEIRRWLGIEDRVWPWSTGTIWPWMLDDLAGLGIVRCVDPDERREGFQRYVLASPAEQAAIQTRLIEAEEAALARAFTRHPDDHHDQEEDDDR